MIVLSLNMLNTINFLYHNFYDYYHKISIRANLKNIKNKKI